MSSYCEYRKRQSDLTLPDPDDIRLLLVDLRFRTLKRVLAENLHVTNTEDKERIPGIIGEAVVWLAEIYPEKLVRAFKTLATAPEQLGRAIDLIVQDNELPVKQPHLLVRFSCAVTQLANHEMPRSLSRPMEHLIRRSRDLSHLVAV